MTDRDVTMCDRAMAVTGGAVAIRRWLGVELDRAASIVDREGVVAERPMGAG